MTAKEWIASWQAEIIKLKTENARLEAENAAYKEHFELINEQFLKNDENFKTIDYGSENKNYRPQPCGRS